jgi:hypothetical protein
VLELENAVLRHQLRVLGRAVKRPPLRRRDRVLLAAVSTLLPRERWSVFLVSPQTLVRWHGELVARKWNANAYAASVLAKGGTAKSVVTYASDEKSGPVNAARHSALQPPQRPHRRSAGSLNH